jgi:hypothetical protein
MEINIANTAVENVLALVNLDNATTFTEAQVTVGVPATWVDPESLDDRNTEVTLTGIDGQGYTGSVAIQYYRLDLDNLKGATVVEFTDTPTATVGEAITAYAATIGLREEELELLNDLGEVLTELPDTSGGPVTLTLRALTDSLLYIGETAVTLNPEAAQDQLMSEAVTTTRMSGFDQPA